MKIRFFTLFLLGLLCSWTSAALAADETLEILSPADAKIVRVIAQQDGFVYSGDEIATLKKEDGTFIILKAGAAGKVTSMKVIAYQKVQKDELLGTLAITRIVADQPAVFADKKLPPIGELLSSLLKTTGIYGIYEAQTTQDWTVGYGRLLMISVGLLLLYLGVFKGFEPLLLVPIGYGAILSNIPLAGIAEPGGILAYIYDVGITTGVFPLLIFMGVGALTDFGPMLANPVTILLGGAAQLGIFVTLLGALWLSDFVPGINFSLRDAASIGIIGGADRTDGDLPCQPALATTAWVDRHCRLFLHGPGASYPAADHALADHRRRAENQDGATAPCVKTGKNHPAHALSRHLRSSPSLSSATDRHVHAR